MEAKKAILAVILIIVAAVITAGGLAGIIITGTTNDPTREAQLVISIRKSQGIPAPCSELQPYQKVKLLEITGSWILQEKLEMPDGLVHHNTLPNTDQTSVCLRTEVNIVSEKEANLYTAFYLNDKFTKNFTGFIKIRSNSYWDFHMLAKDHEGLMLDAVPNKYFVFIECVPEKFNASPTEVTTVATTMVTTAATTAATTVATTAVTTEATTIATTAVTTEATTAVTTETTTIANAVTTAHGHAKLIATTILPSHNSNRVLVPGSVFVYTRGNLDHSDMVALRRKIELTLRHKNEIFLDFGANCYYAT